MGLWLEGISIRPGQRGLSKTEAKTSLYQAIRLFIHLSKQDGGCQDTTMVASQMGHTRLIPKTNCSAKFPYASLTAREHRDTRAA